MTIKKFAATLIEDDKTTACGIYLPFNPKDVWGKVRTPVKVTINNFTFRTTTVSMQGCFLIGVNKANREGAGIKAGEKINVTITLDTEPRVVTPPADFLKALKRNKKAFERWQKLSFTHQKEYVRAIEEVKKAETRARRISKAIEMLGK